jgi:hypothetical protein
MKSQVTDGLLFWTRAMGVYFTACLAAYAAPSPLDNLLQNSPFGGQVAPKTAGRIDAPLEFRGVLTDGGGEIFSLYEASTRSSLWVGQNENGNSFTVRSYDRVNDTITVEYQGKTLTLELKQAKVRTFALPASSRVAVPAAMETPASQPVVVLTSLEARRAANLAEINRRHELSVAAQQTDEMDGGKSPAAPGGH